MPTSSVTAATPKVRRCSGAGSGLLWIQWTGPAPAPDQHAAAQQHQAGEQKQRPFVGRKPHDAGRVDVSPAMTAPAPMEMSSAGKAQQSRVEALVNSASVGATPSRQFPCIFNTLHFGVAMNGRNPVASLHSQDSMVALSRSLPAFSTRLSALS